MGEEFKWRDFPRGYQYNETSFVISDSDDENVENSAKERLFIDESNENDDDSSRYATPKKNRFNDSFSLARLRRNIEHSFENDKITSFEDSTNDSELASQYETTQYSSSGEYSNEESDEEYDLSSSYSIKKKNKGKKRKDVTHDNTKEDIKELKLNSSSESYVNEDNFLLNRDKQYTDPSNEISDHEDKASCDMPVTVELDSDSHSGENSESELAMNLAKEEANVGNINPLVAQRRALIVCKLQSLKSELAAKKCLLDEGNLELLPDNGKKVRENILKQEEEIQKLTLELEKTPHLVAQNSNIVRDHNCHGTTKKEQSYPIKREPSFIKDESSSDNTDYEYLDDIPNKPTDYEYIDDIPNKPTDYEYIDDIPNKPTTFQEKPLGKTAQETRNKELALTVERLQDLHGSLMSRPSEDEKMEDPKGLKVSLMPHQQHALAWLLWREQQKPPGGILADDMGLGKTLTMISLIILTLSDEETFLEKRKSPNNSDDSDDEWKNPSRHNGGTLVICPASLLAQWEKEVKDKCRRGILSVVVHHGTNRENVPSRLARNDIVITTYNIIAREHKNWATLFKIHWKRVILDEAHIVRNPKSQASQAVCELKTNKRWALTGTPIQNKEMDLYSILKFLQCSPFDDLRMWKRWVDNKNAAGHQRLATVMKTLMLRRTKQELQSQGRLESLPDKFMEEVVVKLDPQEQLVYEKILIYSRTLFAQFLAQRAEKRHMIELFGGKYDRPVFLSNQNKDTQFTKAQKKLLALHADVKTHEILVLLLRLRQVCCHPALIHAMLDQEDMMESGITDMENVDPEFIRRINDISLNEIKNIDDSDEEDLGIDQKITGNVLTAQNPVFDDDRVGSKMKALLDMVKVILKNQTNDKLIIVSQWATMLDVIASNLHSIEGATFAKFTGSVAIKDRPSIIDAFNSPSVNPRILLLSLTAGGIGLNLIGGNHLLLFDIHWNPQLETQAQDRIYRFGQKKNVNIYKFICNDTIEERIKALQERKLEIARNVLSGDRSNAMKLTLNDLRSLFAL